MSEVSASEQRRFARSEREGPVATLFLSRPERRNAISTVLVRDVLDMLDQLEADQSVHALVLTGDGSAFSSGGDMAEAAEEILAGEQARLAYLRAQQTLVTRLRDSRLPVIAVVTGPAYGAGWSVVLACDLVVASHDARFCQVFARRNLIPDLGSAWLLPRSVGILAAKELMLLAGEISAERALELGLVNRLVEDRDAALRAAHELGERLAGTEPLIVAMTKSLVNGSQGSTLTESLRLEEHAQALALGTPATLEAVRAFLDKSAASA